MTIIEKKRILQKKLEKKLLNRVSNIKVSDDEAPLLSLIIQKEMNNQSIQFEKILKSFQTDVGFTLKDLDEIIKKTYSNVYSKFFEEQNVTVENSAEFNTIKAYQIEIQSIFYEFCFSNEVVKLFLKDNNEKREVLSLMENSVNQDESIPLIMFKAFSKKHNRAFDLNDKGNFFYRSVEFQIKAEQFTSEENEISFEILSTDFFPVENDDPLRGIAKNFVVCFQGKKVSVFVVIYSPIMGSYSLRIIQDYGLSGNLGILKDNDSRTIINSIFKNLL